MLLCPLRQFGRHEALHPLFPAVRAFLEGTDLGSLPEGRLELQGEALYASVSPRARTRPLAEAPLEAHRAYLDVQVVLEGEDTMGWAPLEACREEKTPYDPAKDIVFYREAPQVLVPVQAGQVIVFFPEDAHAPLIGGGETVKKLVVKVRA